MKLKQFIFALVAMLSFSFSSFAQEVTTEADLKAALQNGAEVTLGGNITVSVPVTIPNGAEVVLNLNGKTLKAANAKTEVLENQGKLTINGQGTVSGIIYNGKASGSAAEMILNGGTYNLDGINGGLHHNGKTLTINDGVVVKTTSYGVRMSGKNSVLNLNGGTYTSTGSGDMARPLALTNGTVNFLDSDITVNGYMHVMVGQVTVNFGENNQYSPFEAYHQGNSYASSVFYCKTLAEAISRTDFAAVTLVKNVKVAADAPITVNKEINLNLNGKNLSATNAKTTVLKNYANMTIKGKGTVTGLVYNGDAENKGVAEMTLNGGTYKLDGANGGFFNYGKTLTVNDGVTISSQVYGLRMSNAASVINLNGGTFTSTNPTDNMKRAIAVDAGTINFNDDDITINGYLHVNRSKAKVNFVKYCPFDAFMYSAKNAGGYYVVNLENAIDKADAGFEIVLQKNIERNEIVTLPKKVTLDGNGKTLTSTAGRAINVDCADVVTIENLTIAGATGCERGINIINKAGTTNLKKVNVSGVSYYAVHVATSAGAAQVNIENSNLTGWAAVAAYGENGTINVKNSNLVGVNTYAKGQNFATIAAASNIAVNVTGGKVTAESFEGKGNQYIVCGDRTGNVTKGASFTLNTELELKGTAEYANIDLDNNTVTVREEYGTNYVTTPAGNGLVTLTGASEAMIGDKKYSTIAQAFAAAKEGETITLIADVAPMLVSQSAITKAAVIDLNGKRLTLNNADLYFGTTTFKNGTIVVAPSVNASTAVFWMFEKQALTFDNVDIVATGVTGTYLIGINGGTGTTVDIINGSSITIDNESKANLTAVICDNGTGNTVTIKDSDIDVKNIEGRFYLGGKNGAVVVENTDADLNGVKEGFYLRAGQSLDIAGTSKVNVVLNSTEGRYGINVTDATAKYNKAETAEVNATVFEKKGGNNFNGYTSADGIWGETWGNAKESFVIKVLDANGNVMGTTSLNNVGGIIDGDVTVSWNLKFNAAANTDEYWTMEWTTAPSISNMPAKVALWVDGVEVSGGDVVLNGPDDINKIYAAATDADGKILSCHTSVANAAATNATNIALLRDTNEEIILPAGVKLNTNGFTAANVKTAVAVIGTQKFASLDAAIKAAKAGDTVTVFEGTYAVPSMKAGITIVGEGNVLFEGTLTGTLENLTMKNIHIKGGNAQRWAYAKGNLEFENVTFEATSVYALHFDGIAAGTNLTYKNCTIIGWAAMGGTPESCVFDGCTIKGNGSYGLIRTYFDTTIKDCTFDVANVNTNDAYEDGIHAVDGANFVVTNCTNKNGEMKDLVNVHATSKVTVDGVVYENVAKVGDNYYATLVEAFAAVGDGADKTVELIADVDLAGAEWTPVNFNGVFDGQGHTISNLVVNGAGKSNQGFFAQTNNGEIKNVTFHNAKVTGRLNVGVVAGTPYTSKYTNVKVTGHVEVNGMAYVGGVGGKNAYANWTDITVDVDETSYVKATSTENGTAYRTYVGGVIGFNGEGGHTFKNISSNIKVIGDVMDIGGIFGILHYSNNAENITFTGAVEAPAEAKEVGGIAGVWHNAKGYVVTIKNAKSEGPVKIGDVTTTGSLVGGAYNANNVTPSTSGSLKVDDKEMWLSVAKIGDTTYRTLADALTAAKDGETVSLLWAEGEAPIAMNGAVFGKNVTITGTAKVDWSKGWLYVGRGGEGNATVTFDGANLTSASNSSSYGIHVSGREKNTNNKYDGTLVIKNSDVDLDYLINRGTITLEGSALTVKNGFGIAGRPAKETENEQDATATITLKKESKLVVNNQNGMGIGQASTSLEGYGIMNIDETSTFKTEQSFTVTANGTVNVNGGNVIIAGKLTNNGTVVVTGTGKSQLDVKNYSGNAIQLKNGNLVDTYFAGRVDAFGTNNISGTTTIGGILGLGYGTNPTEKVVVNITGNFNGTNVLVSTNNGVDNILNVGKADGERTTVHFGQLGAFADVNVVNADVTYGYAFIRNDFNATNSTLKIEGGVNTYFSGNAKVVLDNTTWNLSGYANIGSYGGYSYGNADVTLKNGSSMTATSLGVERSGENVVKLTLEDTSSLTATKLTNQGSIVLASTAATLTANECGNVTTSVPNQVVVYNNGVYSLVAAVAQIGGTAYTSLQDAINAVKDGETVVLVKDFTGNITLTEKVGLHYTLDGAGKQFKGSISVNSLSDTNDNRRITIKNIKFVDDSAAKVDFITSVNTNHYPRLTVEGCTFTGSGDATDVAVRLKSSHSVVINDCTGTGLHSFLQNTSGWNLTIKDVTVTNSKSAFALGTVQGVTVQGVKVDVKGYGIRLDANTYNNNAEIVDNAIKAFIPVVVRDVNTTSNVIFAGKNEFTAGNTDGKWCVIGTTEYEENGKLPAEVAAGNVVVTLKDEKLTYDGIHGAGLAGKGTAEAPYLINNVAELEIFRASVNAGSTKYNAPGLWVALNADIDLANAEWTVGIGDGHNYSFDGNFDGKKHTIKNLNIKPYADADNYICAGLFGYTYGAVTIKNLVIENAKVEFTGAEDGKTYHNVGVLVGFANNKDGKLNVDNVTVKGDIKVDAPQTYGVGAIVGYSYRNMGAITNTNVLANKGSYIKGQRFVAGITGYSYNGAVIDNCTVENLAITGEIGVGGIAGLALNDNKIAGCTVKYVTVNGDKNVAYIVGELPDDGGNVTVADNCNAPQPWVGGSWNSGESFVATIGTQYYTSVAKAIEAAKENDVITLIADITASDIITINKPVTLDGKGKTLTSTAGRAINVDCEGNVGIKNLTINASGERAINVIQKPAKVTIEGVTATAANYTVNLASSAGAAEVAISNSNLTGLNVVNVAAPGSNVTISGGTITCNDQNANENYAALTLNKDAKNGKITAAGVEFNIEGNSRKATNQAEGGIITIDGSADEVEQHVAYISYGNNWYGFATLEAAIAKANAGETVTLLRNVTVDQPVAINKAITLDGNSKTLTYTGASRAITVDNNADADIDVTIKNLTINNTASYTERGINYNENGTLTLENVTVNGEHTTYAINLPGMSQNAKVVITGSKFTGLIALNIWGANTQVTAENSEFYSVDHSAAEGYAAIKLNNNGEIAADNATVVINGGKVIAKDENGAASIAVDDCTNGSTVTISATTEVVGSTTKSVAIISYGSQFYSFSTIEEAIAMAKDNETIELISDVTISYGARDLLATAAANKAVTIDGKGHTLTLNQTNSDWASIGLENNNKLVLKNMTIEKTGYGDTSGAWNTHAIIFSTAVEMENVTVNNSVAVQAGATLNNVTIKEANGYYGLWINGNGQAVTVNGGSITATNGGRGIKIADQYIDAPAKVTLNVTGTKFTTAKKAAVLVSSKAGAEITAANVNIENVAEDKVNFVWVDGDWATYFGNVTVNGAPAVMEDATSFVAAVTVNGAVQAYYKTIAEAIDAAEAGATVTILAGDYTGNLNVNKGITVQGEVDAEGKNLVTFNGKLNITANGAAVKNIDVKNSGTAAYINAADVLVENCNLEGSNGLYQSYAKGTVTFKNSVITGSTYGVHFDGSTGGNIVIENCTITGWTSFAGTIANVAISKTTFADGNYNQLRFYQNATITECTFNEKMTVDFGKNEVEAEFTKCTVENGGDLTDVIYLGDIADMGVKVTIDGNPVCVQAKVGGNYYQTILEAVEAAKTGETVTVLTDVNVDTKNCVTCGGYSSIFNVKGIELTFDLNGHTITVVADPADFADGKAKGNMLMGVFTVDEGGKLTIDNSSDDKTGAVNVSANGATVYSLAAAYGKDAKLTINNGSYYVDEMPEATSLIYAQHSECVIINGGTYNIGNVGTMANGSPWIFNTKGQNMDGIYVNGGTYPNDINHQFWFNEAIVPGNLAVKANENGTWSVVEAVAYTNEVGRSTGSWRRNVGYATIEEAIAATKMYNCEGNVVTLAKNVEIEQMITVANGVEVTLDLNGKTLAATDKTSKNYSAIDNRGELTIVDSSERETGKITVTATVNSGWNRYSAVIANNPGGELTVMSGTIEHLGGTDMAYGIDNLTNGKGTHAVTEIYGGVVKSPYRAVRQFLNGVEANNTLAVYGGTLEGANKSIWMQDPSKNANTGNLYVGEEAVLNGDVYLTVTAGSTEWPVEAYIEKAALAEGKTVLVSNVPADAAALVEYKTFWQVEQKNLKELTIVDEDYTEYINQIEKNVAELTYVRDFTGEWETIYLPFGFTITEDMAKEFEFAYIYNASYKGKQATFEFVEVGAGFNLAANYPYLVKAREAGENEIVVENAKLMPTKVETIDCSSIFEKFSFIGNYATVDADNLDATMGYFSLNGAWSKMGVVSPFRFYMQIQLRNGDAFEYPSEAQPIRMRSVNANGEETTGINGVDAEQADDFIFDIHGRRVLETEKGGIYIKGGKKFIAQ